MNFENLPPELLRVIFLFISLEDLHQHVMLVCRQFESAATDSLGQIEYYRKQFQRHFPHVFAEISSEEDKKISRGENGGNWAQMLRATYHDEYQKLSPPQVRRIFSLVKENDTETLQSMIKAIPELLDYHLLEKKDSHHISLIEWAREVSQNMMDTLYQIPWHYFGANALDVNKIDGPIHHRTILYWAIRFYQSPAHIEELLASGSSLEESYDEWRYKPFHFAIRLGHLALVKALISQYPYLLEQTEENGNTPLMAAAETGQPEIVAFLLSKGANMMRIREDGKHALNIAVEKGHILTTIEILKASADAKPSIPMQLILGPRSNPELPLSAEAIPIDGEFAAQIARAQAGRLSSQRRLIVTGCGEQEIQPIHVAALQDDVEMMQTLLQYNPLSSDLLEQRDLRGYTPLMIASMHGYDDVVEFCLKHHVNLDAESLSSGKNAFYYATERNYTNIALKLLKAGENVQIRVNGKFPIHVAIINKNIRLVSALLLKYPRLCYVLDGHNQSLMRMVLSSQDYDMALILLRFGVKLSSGGSQDEIIKHAEKLMDKIIQQKELGGFFVKLIKANPFLLDVEIEGYTLLQRAVKAKNAMMLKLLLAREWKQININASFRSDNGHPDQDKTALYMAVEEQFEDGVRLLVAARASASVVRGESSKNCIHLAAKIGHVGILSILIDKHPKLINRPDSWGRTPLHIAVFAKNIDAVECLVKRGAALNIEANYTKSEIANLTPLRLAIKLKYDMIAAFLIRSGAAIARLVAGKHTHPIHKAVTSNRVFLLDALIDKHNYMLQLQDESGRTPLQLAASQSNFPLVKRLLECDKDLISKVGGIYLLQLAIYGNSLEAVKMIVEESPSILSQEVKFGRNPLLAAVQTGNFPIVEYLLEKGATIYDVSQGKSALQLAAQKGDDRTCHAILKQGAFANIKRPLVNVSGSVNKEKLTKSIAAEIDLLDYESKRANEGEYKHYLNLFGFKIRFFGKKIGLGCSKERKLAAVAALKQYRFFGADKSTLKEYRRELNNGQLKLIRRNLGIRNI